MVKDIPVYTAAGERMPVTFPNFDAAEEFQRVVIADLLPHLFRNYVGICRDIDSNKIGRPMFSRELECEN